MARIYGYIRVSSKDQNEDRQLIAMNEAGVSPKYIYMDKQSGKDFERAAYKKLVKRIKEGDCLIVKSIDRLGRNYKDIMEQWRIITKEIGADIIILDMPLLDTTKSKDLLGTFISDVVLQLLSFVAENERDNIRRRQAEGIAAAKSRGVVFGNHPKQMPDNFPELIERWQRHDISTTELAKHCGVAHSTIYKKIKEFNDEKCLHKDNTGK